MRKILCFLLSLSIFMLCSCTKKQIVTNKTDEFTMHAWHYEGDYGLSADLAFTDDKANFAVYDNGKKTLELNGMYSITDKTFTITDSTMSYSITFEYYPDGNTCKVTYGNNSITMTRTDTDS